MFLPLLNVVNSDYVIPPSSSEKMVMEDIKNARARIISKYPSYIARFVNRYITIMLNVDSFC